jgi:Family of unknown function (DUF6463)
MLRITGYWWIIVSIIHGVFGVVVYANQWQAIAQEGWFNVVAPNPFAPMFDREDAFWFMFLTPFILLQGMLCLWADRQKLTLPLSIGGILLVTVLVGLFLMPISGFWLVLPPSFVMFWSSYQTKSQVNPSLR